MIRVGQNVPPRNVQIGFRLNDRVEGMHRIEVGGTAKLWCVRPTPAIEKRQRLYSGKCASDPAVASSVRIIECASQPTKFLGFADAREDIRQVHELPGCRVAPEFTMVSCPVNDQTG
jgi:hypothetical protein